MQATTSVSRCSNSRYTDHNRTFIRAYTNVVTFKVKSSLPSYPCFVCLQMSLKGERSHKIEHREMFMLHRMDVQRLSGKKGRHGSGQSCLIPRPLLLPVSECLQYGFCHVASSPSMEVEMA